MKHEYKIYQLDAHDENVLKDHKKGLMQQLFPQPKK